MQEVKLIIKRGWWDIKPRLLLINEECIQFEDQDMASDPFTRFNKSEITAFRFGVKWIRGFEFTVGREYRIHLLNSEGKDLKIHFKTFYGVKRKELHVLYASILKELWNFYFTQITDNLLDKFRAGEDIKIHTVHVMQAGIEISRNKVIPWEKVRTREYKEYYAIFSIDDPARVHSMYTYLDDWNTAILNVIVQTILSVKNTQGE